MCKFFLLAPLALTSLLLPAGAQTRGDREPERRVNTDEAIKSCQSAIQQEARERFGNAVVNFRQTNIDNNPGRNDWVVGTLAVKVSRWRPREVYRFSCSVDFGTGRLRTAHIGVPNF